MPDDESKQKNGIDGKWKRGSPKKISPTIQMYDSAAAAFGSRPPAELAGDGLPPGVATGGGFCIS